MDRVTFVCELAECLLADKPMVFMDETSANLWNKKRTCWTPVDNRLKLPLTSSRGISKTVIGGISLITHTPFTWTLAPSTNTDNFIRYLTYLRTQLKPEYTNEKITIVLDNHSAHTNSRSR